MDVIIIGAGQAGRYIAHTLSSEDYQVTLIDPKAERIEEAESELDIRTICDHGANTQVLERAGVRGADLVAAVTQSDEVNLIVALTAKQLGAHKTAARCYSPTYLEGARIAYRNLLGIDLIIAPHILTAFELAKHVDHPAAFALESFARGAVQLRQMTVHPDAPIAGKLVPEAFPPSVSAILASIRREDETLIPGAKDRIMAGDLVTVITPTDQLKKVRQLFKDTEPRPRNILIAGGGSTAFHLAKLLDRRHFNVRLIEKDRDRCEELARVLKRTTIIHGDVTRQVVLREENLESVGVFIACCGNDQTNLITSVMAKELGAKTATVVLNRADFLPVIDKTGIDHAVSPRILTATRILTLAGKGHISSVASLDNGKAEILELEVRSGCKAAGKTLGKNFRLPEGSILGAVVRGEEVLVPRGGTEILPGDTVIAIALEGIVHEVTELFE